MKILIKTLIILSTFVFTAHQLKAQESLDKYLKQKSISTENLLADLLAFTNYANLDTTIDFHFQGINRHRAFFNQEIPKFCFYNNQGSIVTIETFRAFYDLSKKKHWAFINEFENHGGAPTITFYLDYNWKVFNNFIKGKVEEDDVKKYIYYSMIMQLELNREVYE
jgi:hypothetical protein